MSEQTYIPSAAKLLASACAQCTFALMTTLNSGRTEQYYPLMLIPYALILFAADRVFLRRERTMTGLALLNGGMFLAAFLSLFLLGGVHSWGGAALAGAFCLWLAVCAGQLSLQRPTLSQLILNADLCLVLLAVFTAYLTVMELPVFWCGPIAAGCAASILGILAFRAGSGLGPGSWGFLGGMFAGVFAMVWLLVSFVAAPAGKGLVTLWNWLISAVLFLLDRFCRLLLLLASLFPDRQYEELVAPSSQQLPEQMAELAQEDPVIWIVLLVVLGIGIALIGVIALRFLRRLRLPAIRARSKPAVRHSRVSLLSAVRRLLKSWIERARLQLWLWRNRDTARGLYFLLVGRSSRTPWHKQAGETPREFLFRLERQAVGNPELTQALEQLIPAVDQALFALDAVSFPMPQARLIRSRLGRAIRREQIHSLGRELIGRLGHLKGTSDPL